MNEEKFLTTVLVILMSCVTLLVVTGTIAVIAKVLTMFFC